MRTILTALALGLGLAGSAAYGQLGPKDGAGLSPTDLDRVKVGSPAPDFVLEGMDGKRVALADFRGKKCAVLVFYRGQW